MRSLALLSLLAVVASSVARDECRRPCPKIYEPVCGTDGNTYDNKCLLQVASCLAVGNGQEAITIKHLGPCVQCKRPCPKIMKPVCGTDDKTYNNKCLLLVASCESLASNGPAIFIKHPGRCLQCKQNCPRIRSPVCGTDLKTYNNKCLLELASCESFSSNGPLIFVRHPGPCLTCDKKCPKISEPVCGTDGKTHPNKCMLRVASCESVSSNGPLIFVKYPGACKTCSFGCPKIHEPVCGTDGKTYGNKCLLRLASCESMINGGPMIFIKHKGECTTCNRVCGLIYRPVCGNNSVTYPNRCTLRVASCESMQAGGPRITVASEGTCKNICDRPCFKIYRPVCGSDNKTYDNLCSLKVASCRSEANGNGKITFMYVGKCSSCIRACPANYQPVCGSDGMTHPNRCSLRAASCKSVESGGPAIIVVHPGECKSKCQTFCSLEHAPVCGSDRITYPNKCNLKVASCLSVEAGGPEITVMHDGQCTSCNLACPLILLPVCGSDGVTHPNECTLESKSCISQENGGPEITVRHPGPCESTCNTVCPSIYRPVCGTDMITYPNFCEMRVASCRSQENGGPPIVDHEGPCKQVPLPMLPLV